MPNEKYRILKSLTRLSIIGIIVVFVAMYFVGCIAGNMVLPKTANSLPHWIQIVLFICFTIYAVAEVWGMLSNDKNEDKAQ